MHDIAALVLGAAPTSLACTLGEARGGRERRGAVAARGISHVTNRDAVKIRHVHALRALPAHVYITSGGHLQQRDGEAVWVGEDAQQTPLADRVYHTPPPRVAAHHQIQGGRRGQAAHGAAMPVQHMQRMRRQRARSPLAQSPRALHHPAPKRPDSHTRVDGARDEEGPARIKPRPELNHAGDHIPVRVVQHLRRRLRRSAARRALEQPRTDAPVLQRFTEERARAAPL